LNNPKRSRWADDLENLPTLDEAESRDLKYDDGRLRVWLSRRGRSGGDPFDRTVYVEERKGGGWWEVGPFDGDILLPSDDLMEHPIGTLGDAWEVSSRAAGMTLEIDYPDIAARLDQVGRDHGVDPPGLG
jgi:hypothetical protein